MLTASWLMYWTSRPGTAGMIDPQVVRQLCALMVSILLFEISARLG